MQLKVLKLEAAEQDMFSSLYFTLLCIGRRSARGKFALHRPLTEVSFVEMSIDTLLVYG